MKGKRHSEESKKKMSESHKGNQAQFGKRRTEETKKKLSESHKGYRWSEESKQKLSASIKGEKHPLYGKHHSKEAKIKMSKAHKGKKNPKLSEIRKGYIGEKATNWKGGNVEIKCQNCCKQKYVVPSQIKYGHGKFCSRSCSSVYSVSRQKKKNTDIERLMENELIRRNIPYTRQVALLGITVIDFLLPNDTVIYCDGAYWHSSAKVKTRDINQNFMLTFYGYNVFRFTDNEIKKSTKKCVDKICYFINNLKKEKN